MSEKEVNVFVTDRLKSGFFVLEIVLKTTIVSRGRGEAIGDGKHDETSFGLYERNECLGVHRQPIVRFEDTNFVNPEEKRKVRAFQRKSTIVCGRLRR